LDLCCAEQWADALHQWLGITDDCVHMVTKGKDCQLEGKKFQFLITSYNFVPKLKDQLQELAPQVMVLDEAHSIKASKVRKSCTRNWLQSAVMS
jgi:SWI/SNF-related matrix-associated actin-dependent regulator 1 of chromatin subfamily A